MPTKAAIKAEKDFAAYMAQLMEVMKGQGLASYVKMKKAREGRFEKFLEMFAEFFMLVDLANVKSPFIHPECDTLGIVMVTSEESFMSGLNSKVVRLGFETAAGRPCEFLVTGKKGGAKLKIEGMNFTVFPALREKNFYSVAVAMKDHLFAKVRAREIGPVVGIFADPVSFSAQQASAVHLIPACDAYPKEMKEAADPKDKIHLESKIDNIMGTLLEFWIVHRLFSLFQDNKLSEYAAQSMQLEGSLQNLTELNRKLQLTFVKKRGESIDSSLRETVSSMMATGG